MTWAERSNVAIRACEPACDAASRAAIAMSGSSARTASIVGSSRSVDSNSLRVAVMSPLPATSNRSTPAAKAVAALLECDVGLLVDDAQDLCRARGCQLGARSLAGFELGLPYMGEGSKLLEMIRPRVQRDDRNAGVDGAFDRRRDRVGVRGGDCESVDVRADGAVDQSGLALWVIVRRRVAHANPEVTPRVEGTALLDRPERTSVTMGHDRDRDLVSAG